MDIPHSHEHGHDRAHDKLHARARLQAHVKALLLIGLGLYFVWNIVSGNLANYINARFAWLSYVAAAILLLLGCWQLWLLLRGQTTSHDHEHEHDHDHGVSWGIIAIVALPLLLGTLVPSRPLGVEAIEGSISISQASASADNVAAFTISPLERNVLDWLRVFNSTTDFNELNGQPADVIGFVYTEPSFAESQFMVARYAVSCCVADASALGLPATWADTASLEPGQWVRAQGTFQVATFRGDLLPVLQVESLELIAQPAHPYLYP